MGQRDRTGFDSDSGFVRKAGGKDEFDAGGSTPASSGEIGGGGGVAGVDFDLGIGRGGSAGAGGFRADGGALSQNDEGGGEDEEVQSLMGAGGGALSQNDEGGSEDEEVQSVTTGGSGGEDRLVEPTARGVGLPPEMTAGGFRAGGGALSQSDEGGGEDEEVQSLMGAGGGAPSQNADGGGAADSGTPERRPPGTDLRGEPIPGYEEGAGSTASTDSTDSTETYQVREGVTRAVDPDDLSTVPSGAETEEQPHRRVESIDSGTLDPTLDRPPDLPESVDVTNVAPDGTTIGGSRLTSPTGEAVDGSGLSDAIESRAGELGGDALGRGIDFDPLASGTQGSAGETTPGGGGDRDMDRLIQSRDGSYVSDDRDPVQKVGDAVINFFSDLLEKDGPAPEDFQPLPGPTIPENRRVIEPKFGDRPEDLKPLNTPSGQPDPTAGDDVLTGEAAERAIASHGPGVYSQPTQDEGEDSSGTSTVQWNAPTTDPRISNYGPDGEQTVDASGWTPPPDGIFDPPPDSAAAGASNDVSAGGGETAVPTAPPAGGADALAGNQDVNGVSMDAVTGQVIGSAAPATGGELDAAGGVVSQGDEGDGDDGDGGVQSFSGATATSLGGAGSLVSQGDEGDEDDGVQSLAGGDAAMAIGAPDTGLVGSAPTGAPGELEGPPAVGEEGPVPGEEG